MLEPGKPCCGDAPEGIGVQPRLRNERLLLQNCLGGKSFEGSSRVVRADQEQQQRGQGGAATMPRGAQFRAVSFVRGKKKTL